MPVTCSSGYCDCAHGCLGIRFAVPIPDLDAMLPTVACALSRSTAYDRRQPERTLLYRTVQAHLATWLAHWEDGSKTSRRHSSEGIHVLGFDLGQLDARYCVRVRMTWPVGVVFRCDRGTQSGLIKVVARLDNLGMLVGFPSQCPSLSFFFPMNGRAVKRPDHAESHHDQRTSKSQ